MDASILTLGLDDRVNLFAGGLLPRIDQSYVILQVQALFSRGGGAVVTVGET